MVRRPLVTAEDVRRSAHPTIPEGAILTPLARDLLRERGIHVAPEGARRGDAARLVIANWKSHKTIGEARAWAAAFRAEVEGRSSRAAPVVCPPFTALAALAEALAGAAAVGAQDLSAEDEGAHTGEVAARHLLDAGCRYALVGHSERRAGGETCAHARAKVRAGLRSGLTPVLCVGETADERRAGRAEVVTGDQVRAALEGLAPSELGRVVVAYEPRWAIGRGVTPTADEITSMLGVVRAAVARLADAESARRISVLYGGSVNAENAGELLGLPGCSGGLVGGASLSAPAFARILGSA